MTTQTYLVDGMTCGHCVTAVESEVGGVPGVDGVRVDLMTTLVTVTGDGFEDAAVRAAIAEAGYEAE